MLKLYSGKAINEIKSQAGKEAVTAYLQSRQRIENEIYNRASCAVYFDFNDSNLRVFSIERVGIGTTDERTIIGYYIPSEMNQHTNSKEKIIHEWFLLISREEHNRLVKEWSEHI